MNQKISSMLFATIFIFSLSVPAFAAPSAAIVSSDIKIILNGESIQFDQPPIIEGGRTLVPLRAIFEAMGATVDWNQATQTAIAIKDDITVSLTIGSNVLIRNGENIILDVPAQLIGGRTLAPARAVAESFEATVDWDRDTHTVIITYAENSQSISEQVPTDVTIRINRETWELSDTIVIVDSGEVLT